MIQFRRLLLFLYVTLIFSNEVWSQEITYKGEWTVMASQIKDQKQTDWLARYLPEFNIKGENSKIWTWDASLAAYLYAYDTPNSGTKQDAEVFRAWFRFYDETTEYRIGLQELSFGPAVLLRSLQWFDTKNALDPTSFTKGVKGALARISTEDNSAYWIWGLYGNENLYSSTLYASDPEQPEWGGRAQFSGEIAEWALTLHQRQAILPKAGSVNEKKLALDFKLDLTYNGLWLESMAIKRADNLPCPSQERLTTIGLDYTLDIQEGILLTFERNWGEAKTSTTDFVVTRSNTALMAGISQGLLDSYSLTWMSTEIPKTSLMRFDWKRTYDDYLWDLSLFQSKDKTAPAQMGLGLLVQYNH